MTKRRWSKIEDQLIVKDYFSQLAKELSGTNFNMRNHRQKLLPMLDNRQEQAVLYRYQRISAILKGLGETWIGGYNPLYDFPKALVSAVDRQLSIEQTKLNAQTAKRSVVNFPIAVESAPTMLSSLASDESDRLRKLTNEYETALRDARNRELGRAGEEMVLKHERSVLKLAGRSDLAKKIRWVAQEDGDGAGFDIHSFDERGRNRYIEVKTTNGGWIGTPFYITRNEQKFSDRYANEWCVFRLWNFRRQPKAFELRSPLANHVNLVPTVYRAQFN